MNVLFAENESIGVMIVEAPAQAGVLSIIVVVDGYPELETVLYLKLSELRLFLEAMHATR